MRGFSSKPVKVIGKLCFEFLWSSMALVWKSKATVHLNNTTQPLWTYDILLIDLSIL